jgi:hypothetical protein
MVVPLGHLTSNFKFSSSLLDTSMVHYIGKYGY